jgi:outer membrane protein assembly factor BamB
MHLASHAALLALLSTSTGAGDWPGWRGPHGSGLAPGSPPVAWSETENVRWKVALPGKGLASPIVWGDRVFVPAAVATGKTFEGTPAGTTRRNAPEVYQPIREQELLFLCLDRATGKELWRKSLLTVMPHQTTHPDASYATPTPATDGERVYVSYGSSGVFALSLAGEVAWHVDLGDLLIQDEFGEGSSPVLVGELLVLLWDHEGDSFLVALDKQTGAERWRTPRPKGTSWTTPVVVRAGGRDTLVVGGARTLAYDAASGKELWSYGPADAGGGMAMASPAAEEELVLVAVGGRTGGDVHALLADPGVAPDEPVEPLWTRSAAVPGVPSLLAHAGKLYFLKGNSGQLSAIDLATGAIEYGPERLQGVADVYASPVAADGRLYVAGRDGTVEVLSMLPEIETLAVNVLEDAFDASPAIAGDELFLRGRAHLYCIAEKP